MLTPLLVRGQVKWHPARIQEADPFMGIIRVELLRQGTVLQVFQVVERVNAGKLAREVDTRSEAIILS